MQNMLSSKDKQSFVELLTEIFNQLRDSDHGSPGEAVLCWTLSLHPDALLPDWAKTYFHLLQPHSSLPRAIIQEMHPEKALGHLDYVCLMLRAEVSMSPAPLDEDSAVASWQLCLLTLANRKHFTASKSCLDHVKACMFQSTHFWGNRKALRSPWRDRKATDRHWHTQSCTSSHRRYKSSSEPASAGHTMKSWHEPSPLKTTDGETWRGETKDMIRPSLLAFSHPCLTASCEKLKTGCWF